MRQDIEETELEALSSDLHSSALNAIKSIPSEGGNGEHEVEDGQTIYDVQKKVKLDNEDRKINRIGSGGEKRPIQQQGRWHGINLVLFFMERNLLKPKEVFVGNMPLHKKISWFLHGNHILRDSN